jgi:hypothetical protein
MGEELRWILSFLVAFASLASLIWWRVESTQNRKIDDLSERNHEDHGHLHKKIDNVRDKVEDIWKELVRQQK